MSSPGPIEGRIGVCSWSLRPRDPADLIQTLGRLGIDAVQLALTPLIDQPAIWASAIDRLRDAGIRIVSGMIAMRGEEYSTLESIARTGGVRQDHRWPENRHLAQAAAELAGRAGIGLVTFHAGFLPEDPADPHRRVMLDRVESIARILAGHGVASALETGQETAATLAAALAEMGESGPGVNFDPANMILYGKGDPVQSLRMLAGRVRQIHVKDALPTQQPGTWGREVPAGQGAVDWPAFFEVAEGIEPVVNYVIEREAGPTREADIAAARDLIGRLATDAGGAGKGRSAAARP
jgi:L-ribulose-5-phosphate 3-epimerase